MKAIKLLIVLVLNAQMWAAAPTDERPGTLAARIDDCDQVVIALTTASGNPRGNLLDVNIITIQDLTGSKSKVDKVVWRLPDRSNGGGLAYEPNHLYLLGLRGNEVVWEVSQNIDFDADDENLLVTRRKLSPEDILALKKKRDATAKDIKER